LRAEKTQEEAGGDIEGTVDQLSSSILDASPVASLAKFGRAETRQQVMPDHYAWRADK